LEISLEQALKKGEGQTIEFKSGIVDSNVAKILAAFANTNPGNVFIGVEDNGGVSGLREKTPQERDQLLRKIRQLGTMIQPPVLPGATFLYYDGKTVLRLFVPKGSHPLYVLQGTVWIRRLAEVVAADRQEIIERALGARRTRAHST
jgi:ATP-dependent DNA helicase RecG